MWSRKGPKHGTADPKQETTGTDWSGHKLIEPYNEGMSSKAGYFSVTFYY